MWKGIERYAEYCDIDLLLKKIVLKLSEQSSAGVKTMIKIRFSTSMCKDIEANDQATVILRSTEQRE